MQKQKKQCLLAICMVVGVLGIKGCATGRSIGSADDITDTGKTNVVLLSYEITADVFDRHASVKSTSIGLKCGRPSGNISDTCFQLSLPFTGLTAVEDSVYHRFVGSKAQTFTVEYGDYPLKSLAYDVVHTVRQEPYCYVSKKTKKTVCSTRTVRDKNRFRATLPDERMFSVKPGNGCYLGHMKLRVVGDQVVDYTIDTKMSANITERLPQELRAATQAHVTESCFTT